MGPGGLKHITIETKEAILASSRIYLRTNQHPSASIVTNAVSFDDLYTKYETFEEVYNSIFTELINQAQVNEIVYVTPGSPLVLEKTVQLLLEQYEIETEILPAMSFLDIAWSRLKIDPVNDGVKLVDAQQFDQQAAGESGPLLVAQTFSKKILSDIKLSVDDENDNPVVILQNLGAADENIFEVNWHDLDRSFEPNHLTSVYIPTLNNSIATALQNNVELIHTLRQKCPWDKEQTHESLKKHLVEETNEVIEAIDNLNYETETGYEELEEELGDLWLQILLHSELAAEKGQFDISNVAGTLQEKMIRRHPHVFGESEAKTLEELSAQWESIKKEEKKGKF